MESLDTIYINRWYRRRVGCHIWFLLELNWIRDT